MDVDINRMDIGKTGALERLRRYKEFIKYDPHNLQLTLDAIRLAVELQDWEFCSFIASTTSGSAFPLSAELNSHLAYFYMIVGDYSQALQKFELAIASGERSPVVYFNLAQTYFFLANFENAYKILTGHPAIEEVLPQEFLLLLARLQHHLDQSKDAIFSLEQLHKNFAGSFESKGLLALILFEQGGDYQRSQQLADDALLESSNALEALLARASLALFYNNFDLAISDLEHASRYYPDNGRVWSGVALAKFNSFRFSEALDAAKIAVELMPDHIGTWHILGWSGVMEQRLEMALDAFQQAYNLERNFADTHGGLAAVYAHMGNVKMANYHIKLAEKLSSEDLAAVYAKIVLLKMNNQFAEANDLFEQSKHIYSETLGTTLQVLIDKRAQDAATIKMPN